MKIRFFLFAMVRWGRLYYLSAYTLLTSFSIRRFLMLVLLLPLFSMLQAVHWLAFLLDEFFFPGYRRIPVRNPVFIIGLPRSGTTFLHRVVAKDPQFTTMLCWECLLAPSIIERKVLSGLAALHGYFGHPLSRLSALMKTGLCTWFDAVHKVRMTEPEEDYLTLLPILSCFLLVLALPEEEEFWRLGLFDRKNKEWDKAIILRYYRAMLQKHLFVHDRDKTMLSKNPAFCSLLDDLRSHFPDCRIIIPRRNPVVAYRSQLSSIIFGLRLLQTTNQGSLFASRFLALFVHYCTVLAAFHEDGHAISVEMEELRNDLQSSLSWVYRSLGLQMAPIMVQAVVDQAEEVRSFQSTHAYDLELFDLDEAQVEQYLAPYCSAAGGSMEQNGVSLSPRSFLYAD